jgi:hypothetical protein
MLHQWFKNGDHPEDKWEIDEVGETETEGLVVRYYRHPMVNGKDLCGICKRTMHEHGFIDQGEKGIKVCPSDWIGKNMNLYFKVTDQEKKKLEHLENLK